ncbi:MAG: endoflagellar filament sheath protein [Leptospiraceae bacterium]|nr:endoflagellar filament sheath protein [Leptospiraceae bacterium]
MGPLAAQEPATDTGNTPDPNAPENQVIQVGNDFLYLVTVENFEEAEDWVAKATCPLGETKTLKLVQRGEIRATDDENETPPADEAYSVNTNPDNPNHILGVKTYFQDRGFDRVEVMPPHEFVIKGKARQFSIWVLGRKFRHTLYLKLRDYRGRIHKLRMGRLDFFGWRKLTVTVPGWLPQSTRYSMLDKNLHFVSLFVESDVHEIGGTFYFYIDGLKALIDRSEQVYPGSEIRDNW